MGDDASKGEARKQEAMAEHTDRLEVFSKIEGPEGGVNRAIIAWAKKAGIHDPERGLHNPQIVNNIIGNITMGINIALERFVSGEYKMQKIDQMYEQQYSDASWRKIKGLDMVPPDAVQPAPGSPQLLEADKPIPGALIDYYIAEFYKEDGFNSPPFTMDRNGKAVTIPQHNAHDAILGDAMMVAWNTALEETKKIESQVTSMRATRTKTGWDIK